jgi:hypothetical protein
MPSASYHWSAAARTSRGGQVMARPASGADPVEALLGRAEQPEVGRGASMVCACMDVWCEVLV